MTEAITHRRFFALIPVPICSTPCLTLHLPMLVGSGGADVEVVEVSWAPRPERVEKCDDIREVEHSERFGEVSLVRAAQWAGVEQDPGCIPDCTRKVGSSVVIEVFHENGPEPQIDGYLYQG